MGRLCKVEQWECVVLCVLCGLCVRHVMCERSQEEVLLLQVLVLVLQVSDLFLQKLHLFSDRQHQVTLY